MFRLQDIKRAVESLASLTDEELTAKIQHLMWEAARVKNRETVLSELKSCYNEAVQRQKIHLWERAKGCYLTQRGKFA